MKRLRAWLSYAAVCWGALPSAAGTTIDELAWLKGCWTSATSGERKTAEHWMKPEGGTMLGMSRTVVGARTVEFEFIRIAQEANGEIYFIAKPSGQAETRFKLIKGGQSEAVFENPAHDFPQRVIYRLREDGSLLGRIEGTTKGQEKAVDYPMKRSSCDE